MWRFLHIYLFILAVLQVTWNLSFLTRDQTCAPCSGSSRVLITGPPGDFQVRVFVFSFYLFKKIFLSFFGCVGSELQHTGSLIFLGACGIFFVATRGIFSCGMWTLSAGTWNLVPWPGIEPRPLALGAKSLSHWTHHGSPPN